MLRDGETCIQSSWLMRKSRYPGHCSSKSAGLLMNFNINKHILIKTVTLLD